MKRSTKRSPILTSWQRPTPTKTANPGLSFGPHPTHISVLLFRNISVGVYAAAANLRDDTFVEKLPPIHGKFIHS